MKMSKVLLSFSICCSFAFSFTGIVGACNKDLLNENNSSLNSELENSFANKNVSQSMNKDADNQKCSNGCEDKSIDASSDKNLGVTSDEQKLETDDQSELSENENLSDNSKNDDETFKEKGICSSANESQSLDARIDVDIWDYLQKKYMNSNVNELIFIKYKTGSDATMEMYIKNGSKWEKRLEGDAIVGSKGIGEASEKWTRTPKGDFGIIEAFGIKSNPGVEKIKYRQIDENTYCCGDHEFYNQIIDVKEKNHECFGEHMIDYPVFYDYGVFFDYNKERTYGMGAAFFLHCRKDGVNSTHGCIAVDKNIMIEILLNLTPTSRICIFDE